MKITPEQLEHIKNNVEAGLRAANDFVPDWGDEKLLKERCSWDHVGNQWRSANSQYFQYAPSYLYCADGQALAFYEEHDKDINLVMEISEVK